MYNPRFADDENILLVHDEDIDYDDYSTPNTSRLDDTSFVMPWLRGKRSNINFTAKTKSKTR